jgi:AcrR family transcriptional regulator
VTDLTLSRRNKRIQRKREAILAAATRLFAQKGFTSATTKDIADEADIGESTLYNYFTSKRDILNTIMEQQRDLFSGMIAELSGSANRETLIDIVDKTLDTVVSRATFIRTLLSEAWLDDSILQDYVTIQLQQFFQVIQQFVMHEIETGVARSVDPALTTRFVMGMFFSLVLPVLRGVEPAPTPEQRRIQAETLITFLLDGIANREVR